MNDLPPEFFGLSQQTQLYITWGVIIAKYLSELYSSIRGGGGLKRILTSFWLGENLPQPIAQDYEKELQTPAKSPAKSPAKK